MSRELPSVPMPLPERIDALLTTAPADYDYVSTSQFCLAGVDLAMQRVGETLQQQFPDHAAALQHAVGELTNTYIPFTSVSKTVNPFMVTFSRGEAERITYRLNPVTKLVAASRSELLHPRYVKALGSTFVAESQNFPGIIDRVNAFQRVSELPDSHPATKIIGVANYTQIPRIFAVDDTKALLERTRDFVGVASADKISTYLASLQKKVYGIKFHLGYSQRGNEVIKQLAGQAGFNEAQLDLLLDVAFLKKMGVSSKDEFMGIYTPLAKFIAQSNWDAALAHRDFLFQYVNDSFPTWRGEQFAEQSRLIPVGSMTDLRERLADGRINLSLAEVPNEYQSLLKKYLKPKPIMAKQPPQKAEEIGQAPEVAEIGYHDQREEVTTSNAEANQPATESPQPSHTYGSPVTIMSSPTYHQPERPRNFHPETAPGLVDQMKSLREQMRGRAKELGPLKEGEVDHGEASGDTLEKMYIQPNRNDYDRDKPEENAEENSQNTSLRLLDRLRKEWKRLWRF